MIKEIDKRLVVAPGEGDRKKDFENLLAKTLASSDKLSGGHSLNLISINDISSFTGVPQTIISNNAEIVSGSLIESAQKHLEQIGNVIGFMPQQKAEFIPDPFLKITSSNAKVVNFYQQYRGIPIFQMSRAVRFSPDNRIQEVTGNNVQILQELYTVPSLNAQEAFKVVNEYIVNNREISFVDGWGATNEVILPHTSDYVPSILARFNLPAQPTLLEKGAYRDNIPANLTIFYTGNEYRLGWLFTVTLITPPAQFDAIVSADNKAGELIYFHQTSKHIKGYGNVYRFSGSDARQRVSFPVQ